jgi:hypothetical protein
MMVETRTYKNGKLILEDNLDISNIPELSIYLNIFKLFIIIGVILGFSCITAFILLGVLAISDMRVVTAAIFLAFGFIILVVGILIFINPFAKYSRIIHGAASVLTPIPSIRLAKIRNLYLSYPNQRKLNYLLEEVKTTKFRLRILVCINGIVISIISIILYVVFVIK